MSMINLVYVSVSDHPMTDEELRALLEESRENNAKLNVTGMLLYRDGFFIQALEGEEQAVRELYDAIRDDGRHRNIVTVYEEPITERAFSDWSMGFNKMEDRFLEQIPGYTDFLDQPFETEAFTNHPTRAAILLNSFKNRTYF